MQVMTALILKSILWGNHFNNKMCGLIFQETQFGMEKIRLVCLFGVQSNKLVLF